MLKYSLWVVYVSFSLQGGGHGTMQSEPMHRNQCEERLAQIQRALEGNKRYIVHRARCVRHKGEVT